MITPVKKFSLVILALCVVFFGIAIFAWYDYAHNQQLKVVFLDVGQGDAIFIRTPQGQNIVIDGGPDSSVLYRLSKYLPFYDREIDLMILTHPHSDHVSGLISVLEKYSVKQIMGNGVTHTSPDYIKWLELVKNKKIPYVLVDKPQEIYFDQSKNKELVLKILYPQKDIRADNFKDLNESSIITKLVYGQNSFLFMGDLPIDQENELVNSGVDLRADVLKIGHHGSKYSSSLDFLSKVSPKYGVIQSGKKNDFGHPHYRLLSNLEKSKIEILRNDQLGDIVFESNGEELIFTSL
jgi:competence protein ComEC